MKFDGFLRDITEDDKNNDRIYYFKQKWKKRRENEYERIIHEDEFKINIRGAGKYKYERRKNELKFILLTAVSIENVIITVCWDMEGTITVDFLDKKKKPRCKQCFLLPTPLVKSI